MARGGTPVLLRLLLPLILVGAVASGVLDFCGSAHLVCDAFEGIIHVSMWGLVTGVWRLLLI